MVIGLRGRKGGLTAESTNLYEKFLHLLGVDRQFEDPWNTELTGPQKQLRDYVDSDGAGGGDEDDDVDDDDNHHHYLHHRHGNDDDDP